jgi:GAF domain-containing protein
MIKVLLIEDVPAHTQLIKDMLAWARGSAFSLETANRLSTGLEHLADKPTDVVLLDLSLPDCQGLDTFTRVQEQAPHIPVVVLTGLDDKELAIQAAREGAQDYLLKGDVDTDLLTRTLRYAIERKRAEEEIRLRNKQLATLNAISATVNQTLDLDQILDDALREVMRLDIFADQGTGALFLLDHQVQELYIAAQQAIPSDAPRRIKLEQATQCLCLQALEQGQVVTSQDLSPDQYQSCCWPQARDRTFIYLPLIQRQKALGVIELTVPLSQQLKDTDIELLVSISDQISMAIQNARFYQASEEKSARLATLNAITTAAVSSLELDVVLRQTLKMTSEALNAAEGSILLDNSETGGLTFAVTLEEDRTDLLGQHLKPGQGLAGQVAQSGEAVLVNDVRQDARWHSGTDTAIGFKTRSLLAAPLKHQGKVTGVIELVNKQQGEFTEDDLGLLKAVASIIATALENARLFTATRSYANRLAQLHHIGLALTSTLDLSTVVHTALVRCQKLFQANKISLLQPDPETGELRFVQTMLKSVPRDIPIRLKPGESIAGWVLQNQEPVLLTDVQNDPRFSDRVDQYLDYHTRAMMVIPLQIQDRIIGVIEVCSSQPGVYSSDEMNTLQAITSTLSVALENARLYEETAQHLAETQVLQQVISAGASTLDFDQMLIRTLRAIHRTLDVERLALVLPDATGDQLDIHPSRIGFDALPDKAPRIPIQGSVCGQVYTTGQPIIIDDVSEHPDFIDPNYDNSDDDCAQTRSELAVPVKRNDSVTAILSASSSQPDAFNESDLHTFQAIAAQLGIVMENARLYEAEREQRRLVEQSQAQLVQSEKLAATGRLAASLAHEINNPLQAIHNSLQLMLNFPLEMEEQMEYITMADEEVERLMGMVSRILDFARRPQQEMQLISLNDVLTKVITLANKYLQHRHVTLHKDLAPRLPPVMGIAGELGQVFLNLIINAVEAMPEGGSIEISSYRDQEGRLFIDVTDSGPGIPPEHLDRVFEPFFSTKNQGTGLGLAVSYNIIERHEGEITIDSTVGVGTTFSVSLPAAGDSQQTTH